MQANENQKKSLRRYFCQMLSHWQKCRIRYNAYTKQPKDSFFVEIDRSLSAWRRLSNVTTGGQTINYEYDSEGKRTGKQVGTAQTTYLYAGGRLVSIEGHTPDYRIDLLYDESGVYGCIYNDASHTQTKYRFVKNAQGDIIQIRDQSDAVVANYTYDAWGALLSVTDENGAAITASAHIALRNPIRYRGYLYDSETGFYYVSSRYYDPEIGRFLNADVMLDAEKAKVLVFREVTYRKKCYVPASIAFWGQKAGCWDIPSP